MPTAMPITPNQYLVEGIRPAVEKAHGQPGDEIDNVVRANVELVVERLKESPILGQAVENMSNLYHALSELEQRGESGAVATIIRARGSTPRHVGSKMLIYPDGRILGTIGGGEMESRVVAEAKKVMAGGQPSIVQYSLVDPKSGDPGVCGGEVEVFVEPIQHPPTVVVVGAGHVGKAVAHLAKWLGFRVVISDDRPEFANAEAVPGADAYLPIPLAEISAHLKIHPNTYIVLTTRNMMVDVNGLPPLLESEASYIGVIGSRRRWATAAEQLAAQGVSKEKLARVHSPMGLELNAETPEEIAVSILAEIIMMRNGGTGEAMRWRGAQEAASV